jgi:hypothetical protein
MMLLRTRFALLLFGMAVLFSACTCDACLRGAEAPEPPTALIATPGDGIATIAFTAGGNGGAPILNFEYSLDGENFLPFNPSVTTSPVTIIGLANGISYSIQLRAVNRVGPGAASDVVSVTPGAPFNLAVEIDDEEIIVTFDIDEDPENPVPGFEFSLDDGVTWISVSDLSSSGALAAQWGGDLEPLFLRSVRFAIPNNLLSTATQIIVRALTALGFIQSEPVQLPRVTVVVSNFGNFPWPTQGVTVDLYNAPQRSITDFVATTVLTGTNRSVTFPPLLADGTYHYRITTESRFAGAPPEWWGDGSVTIDRGPATGQFTRTQPVFNGTIGIVQLGCSVSYTAVGNWNQDAQLSMLIWPTPDSTPIRIDGLASEALGNTFKPPIATFTGLSGNVQVLPFLSVSTSDETLAGFATDQPLSGRQTCEIVRDLRVYNVGSYWPPSGTKVIVELYDNPTMQGDPVVTEERFATSQPVTVSFTDLAENGTYYYRVATEPTFDGAQLEWWGDASLTLEDGLVSEVFRRNRAYFSNLGLPKAGCSMEYQVAGRNPGNSRFSMLIFKEGVQEPLRIDQIAPDGVGRFAPTTAQLNGLTGPVSVFSFLSESTSDGTLLLATDQDGSKRSCDLSQPAPEIVAGDDQSATVGTTVPNPIQVLVTVNGTPEPGVTVTFSVSSPDSIDGSPSVSVVTGQDGIATLPGGSWIVGSGGTRSLTASVPGGASVIIKAFGISF